MGGIAGQERVNGGGAEARAVQLRRGLVHHGRVYRWCTPAAPKTATTHILRVLLPERKERQRQQKRV